MARDSVSKRMQEQLEQLIGNDPVHAKAALEELAPVAASDVTRVTAFLQQHSDRIIVSFPAITHLAQLFGRLGERGAGALVDCIRSGSWNAKLIAAYGCRYITEPRARGQVEGEMLHLLEDDDPDLVKPAIVALGELGAVRAASSVMKAVLRDEDRAYDLYALDCLLRLIAADDTDT
ncbi:MAG TPA: hypothetical protein VIY29_13690, partial [Ktedonobacteraceae bacterium]